MASLTSTQTAELPWNRNDRTGLAISAVGPAVVVVLENLLIYATGLREQNAAYDAVPLTPPSWVVGTVWIGLFAFWGAARWYARQTGLAGRRRSRWLIGLMAWSLLYPLLTAAGGVQWSALANMLSLALGIVTALQVRGVSKRAFWLTVPSVLWMGFATLLGFLAVANA